LNFEIALNRQNFCVSPPFFVEIFLAHRKRLESEMPRGLIHSRICSITKNRQTETDRERGRERERKKGMDARREAAERNRYAETIKRRTLTRLRDTRLINEGLRREREGEREREGADAPLSTDAAEAAMG